jgi:hypothetical protein
MSLIFFLIAEPDPLAASDGDEEEGTDRVTTEAEAMRILEELGENTGDAAPDPAGSADRGTADPADPAASGAADSNAASDTPTGPPTVAAAVAAEATIPPTSNTGEQIFKAPGGSGFSKGRKDSENSNTGSNNSDYSSALSNCEKNSLPPLYYTVQKARANALAPRILGGGTDPNFFEKFGDFSSDPRHVFCTHRHTFSKKTNTCTSFDPTDMHCNTCEFRHPIIGRGGGGGLSSITPKCFYLADQCFPPALPSTGEGDCLAIIRTESGTLDDLVSAFLDLVRDYEVPVGTVVVITSLTHLGRVGTAVYASDLVKALTRLREAYGDSIRVLHGFPVIAGGLQDEACIRSLLEIEMWLKETDKRNLHRLPDTSDHLISTYLQHNADSNASIDSINIQSNLHRTGIELPASLHSLAKVVIHCPGWENLSSELPILTEDEERSFLSVMLEELNVKFALQLDVYPSTKRFGLDTDDSETESGCTIVLAGGSHASRMEGPLADTYLRVVDVSVPGFRISEESVASMAADLEEAVKGLDPKKSVVLLQPFDNSIYYSSRAQGEKTLTRKGSDRKYHVEGELKMISKEDMKELFILILPLIKAARGLKVIIMGPMPRYLIAKCCGNPGHVTNRNTDSYIDGLIQGIKDVYSWINSTIFLRRIKDVKTFNPTHALGFNNYDVNIDTILELWGEDPVHPTPSGYRVLAERLASMVDDVLTDVTVNNDPPPQQKKRQAVREPWIVASEPVAKRLDGNQAKQKQWQQKSQTAGRARGGPPRGGHYIPRGSYSSHTSQPSRGNNRGRGGYRGRGRSSGPPQGRWGRW